MNCLTLKARDIIIFSYSLFCQLQQWRADRYSTEERKTHWLFDMGENNIYHLSTSGTRKTSTGFFFPALLKQTHIFSVSIPMKPVCGRLHPSQPDVYWHRRCSNPSRGDSCLQCSMSSAQHELAEPVLRVCHNITSDMITPSPRLKGLLQWRNQKCRQVPTGKEKKASTTNQTERNCLERYRNINNPEGQSLRIEISKKKMPLLGYLKTC